METQNSQATVTQRPEKSPTPCRVGRLVRPETHDVDRQEPALEPICADTERVGGPDVVVDLFPDVGPAWWTRPGLPEGRADRSGFGAVR